MIAAVILLAGSAPALDCANAMTQVAMNQCAHRDHMDADRALNAEWVKAVAYMKGVDEGAGKPTDGRPTYSAALLTAQRAWLRYRDAQCLVAGFTMRGGSAEPLAYSSCMARLTTARVAELKAVDPESGEGR